MAEADDAMPELQIADGAVPGSRIGKRLVSARVLDNPSSMTVAIVRLLGTTQICVAHGQKHSSAPPERLIRGEPL